MLRPAIFVPVLVVCGALAPLACTQDFNVFEPGASGGAGGAGVSSSSGPGVTSSSSSSASGSASSSSVTSSSSSSSGGNPPETACVDGMDNDGNGKTDCADANCASLGFTCDGIPNGWTGPVALFEGSPGQSPGCPAAFPKVIYTGNSGLTAADATCNACTCDPAPVTCTPADATFYTDMACSMGAVTIAQSNNCKMINGGAVGAKIPAPTATAGACAAKGGGVNGQPAPSWKVLGLACGNDVQDGKGCNGKEVCTPPVPAGFSKICVLRAGDQACPGSYPTKHLYYSGFKDTRSCTACGCGMAGAASCTVQTTAYPTMDCTGNISVAVPNDNSCFAPGGGAMAGSFKVTGTTPNAPACPPNGGAPTGTVTADMATAATVCCQN